MSGRPFDTADKSYAPRMYVTTDASGAAQTAALGVIQVDLCAMVLRIHDACHAGGGALVPMVTNCPDANGVLPLMSSLTVLPLVKFTANATAFDATGLITHGLGYYPVVQIIDATTHVLLDPTPYVVTHTSNNTISIVRPANSPAIEVVLRG
jgi:hypothetical protein